ncbi:TatD family hydrolase [Neptunomonas antarctica]|uniref:TatD DNase family protein n=1 Tax=Neptunomonas antarctica TaxID=619304 RepID=A0A1N7PJ26_9GAMM|nr:TatD family hydrolase [Neptunomonas antarctica]SIT10653.1 TatD DNase family protein [Neptunomonas antarctica]
MFIDSHCHLDKLDLSPYENNFSAMLDAAFQRDISRLLCVCIDLEKFGEMYSLIQDHPKVFASLGVHPLHVENEQGVVPIDYLIEKVRQHPKIIAIGETGLDYFYQTDTKAVQQQSFINQLRAADQLSLPVIVHTRDAREDTLSLIKTYGGESGGVLHCFTESQAMAEAAIDMNYLISFSGIVTFRNAEELREVVKAIPLDKILIETDAPYLAPIPYRGKKNEPKYVVEVAQCIADLKGVSVEKVAEATSENFYRLFAKAAELDGIR